jgi:hypothetical protein
MSTLTLAPQNILNSKGAARTKPRARATRTKGAKQKAKQEAQELEEQENIKETLKGFFNFIKGKGSYRFLPGTDFKKGIIYFESSNDNITNGTVYADGESEADDDYPFYAY